jgi:outer membrane murein-binding lipoprotein Lpp
MAKGAVSNQTRRGQPPAFTPEARELQLIALATDLAEQQLRDGTASSQVISHFLKLGSSRAELEKEKLAMENQHLRAKTEAIQAQQREDEMFERAIEAMRRYQGASGGSNDY